MLLMFSYLVIPFKVEICHVNYKYAILRLAIPFMFSYAKESTNMPCHLNHRLCHLMYR